jgi:hypothetical protein
MENTAMKEAQAAIEAQAVRVRAALVDFPDWTVEGLTAMDGEGIVRVQHSDITMSIPGDSAAAMTEAQLQTEFRQAIVRARERATKSGSPCGELNADGRITKATSIRWTGAK